MTRPGAIAVPRSLNGARALARNGTAGIGTGLRAGIASGRRRNGAREVGGAHAGASLNMSPWRWASSMRRQAVSK